MREAGVGGFVEQWEDIFPLRIAGGEGAEGVADASPCAEAADEGALAVFSEPGVWLGGGGMAELSGEGGPVSEELGAGDGFVVFLEVEPGGVEEVVPSGEMLVDVALVHAGGGEEFVHGDGAPPGSVDDGAGGGDDGRPCRGVASLKRVLRVFCSWGRVVDAGAGVLQGKKSGEEVETSKTRVRSQAGAWGTRGNEGKRTERT